MTVSDHLIERLLEWKVKRIFGYPGDGINGIMEALGKDAGKGIQFIQVRHEEMSAFMACAHAKFTGDIGVCLATSGPGAIHLLNGLYDAQMRHLIDRAIRIAKAERTVTCLIIPGDVQELEAAPHPPRKHGTIFSGIGHTDPRVIPAEDDLRRAAEVLNAGKRVALLIGAGAR